MNKDKLVKFFAYLAALNCVVIPLLFASGQDPLFPFPGLYLLEIIVVGLAGLGSLLERGRPAITWISAGILLAFVLLGGFSIGFYLIPALLLFLAGGALRLEKTDPKRMRYIGLFFGTAILQAAFMFLMIAIS